MAQMSVASLGANFGALHIMRGVQALGEQIFQDRFAERGKANAGLVFIGRSEKWFTGDDINVDPDFLVIPELILKSPLSATLPYDGIFLGLQSLFQNGVVRNRAVWIESGGLLFLFLRQKKEVEPAGDEHYRDRQTNVHADGRSFLTGDSAAFHQIAMKLIQSDIVRGSRLERESHQD